MNHALLLTDVVDSTKLAERVGDARMAEIWVAHDRAVRDLLVTWRGREIDRTDGFLMLFGDVADAVGFGTAVHAAMAQVAARFGISFAARVGIHWGPVILIETSAADRALGAKPLEVEGLAKPLAARVMSLAAGGQALMTADARAQLGLGVSTVSHGHWRMKGVSEPVELFEVASPGAPLSPPPDSGKVYRVVRSGETWLPARDVPHNLPVERDAFVGRAADLVTLARHLDDGARLVSVLGMGGTGKTRLVTRFAWTWLGDYPGGAWFCDLSEARSVEGIASAVAAALDVPLVGGDPITQLGHAIANRGACLVVLDNFEQVARLAPETLGRWLDRARDAQFVVTTREVLGLAGEVSLALAPLPQGEAVDLFVARASQAKRDFVNTDPASVVALVKLLDGLPLAIELAAARVRVMPPKTLLERMRERFKLLASSGGRHTRQATLRATFDWSWELLAEDERQALAQLSVFEGGFTLEAAEGVLSLSELWPTDAVQSLVDKSWVRAVAEDRFDLLVSVQEYAAEKLDALGGRSEAEVRHGAVYAALGTDEAEEAFDMHGGADRRRALFPELDNLVAAVRRALARSDGPTSVSAYAAAAAALDHRGPSSVSVDLGTHILDGALSLRERARATRLLTGDLIRSGRFAEAHVRCEAALRLARDLGDPGYVATALVTLSQSLWIQGRMDEASGSYDAALAAARATGRRRLEGLVRLHQGVFAQGRGRPDEARAHYEAALGIHREVGSRRYEITTLGNLANLDAETGRPLDAKDRYEAALAANRALGDRRMEAHVQGNLANHHQTQGRYEEAAAHYERALTLHREVGNRVGEALVLTNLGILLTRGGRWDDARVRVAAALAIQRELGATFDQAHTEATLGQILIKLGRTREALAHLETALLLARSHGDPSSEGHASNALVAYHEALGQLADARDHVAASVDIFRRLGDAFELALALCLCAGVDARRGDDEAARAALAEAESLALQLGAGPDSPLGTSLAQARAALASA